MYVIYVGTLPPHFGGTALVAAQLLPGLVERGHRVAALAPLARAARGTAAAGFDQRVRTIRFLMPYDETNLRRPTKPAYRRRQTSQIHGHLNQLIMEERPDVILVGRESFVWGIPDLAARAGIPCALQSHGTLLAVLLDYPEPARSEWLAELAKADLIICCARHLAQAVADRGFSRLCAIANGVDLGRYRPAVGDLPPRLEADTTSALHASNLKPVKRIPDLFAAAGIVRQKRPQLRYLIVGDGPDRPVVEAACRERGVAELFEFTGWVDQMRMPELLRAADMVVMPSRAEGMSLACLEAMACGRLVIAADTPSSRELISDGETGLLFRMGDVERLAGKILLAARDLELRTRIGRAARAHVERHHRLEDMVERYDAVLTRLIEAHRDRAGVCRRATSGA